MKEIDLRKSVYELTELYPEIIEIMTKLGFKDIGNPVVRRTAGKMMTIPMGCKMKGIAMDGMVTELEKQGFVIAEN